ncbi:MAG: FAD-dependent oxidoreductase [Gemmataceae bacterium]|nr:FAD-dependent oxidoreductase [Gemmata sp.]MDW8198625.1 FAD-dependent oxidoreductase [Gemmataceae bacterium]
MARLFSCVAILLATSAGGAAEYDIVVYGGTASGAVAAIQAARMGKSVVLLEPGQHIGGLTSGGLGWTDSGDKRAIGGISREFYQRVKKYYDDPNVWLHEKRDNYKFYRPDDDAMWTFEPKVAEKILRNMLDEVKVKIHCGQRLDRAKGVKLDGRRIVAITMESGQSYSGQMFIDATYEGDLMAAAGVRYTVGRESNKQYGETLNGVARKWNTHLHRFVVNVDPYVKPGDPRSGLVFGIDPNPLPADGEADQRVQAYCFRMCMTDVPANRVPFEKPADYDEKKYELLFRNFEAGDLRIPLKIDRMPNGKTDTNNNCAVSTDFIGQNYAYPEASYAEREKIIAAHLSYQKGLMWSLQNHPRVPEKIRTQLAKWGLAKDEFTDTGHWPHQLYIREARRMVSDYVITERDCRRQRDTPQSVGMGSYNMDSHNCTRYVTPAGFVQNEGDVQVSPGGPYRISYKAIVPKAGECPNLLVPVCVSSSHIAYGSIRMEPVFMILGQSAATAACLAIDDKVDVQSVNYEKLRKRLLADKQVLELAAAPAPGAVDPKKLPGIVVDDADAERTGFDTVSTSVGPFVGSGYRHDSNTNRGQQSARFVPDLPAAGRYEVRLAYTAHPNRATRVSVQVTYAGGNKTLTINQQKKPPVEGLWISLGTFEFDKGTRGCVTITNDGADGFVVIDAVQWLPVK